MEKCKAAACILTVLLLTIATSPLVSGLKNPTITHSSKGVILRISTKWRSVSFEVFNSGNESLHYVFFVSFRTLFKKEILPKGIQDLGKISSENHINETYTLPYRYATITAVLTVGEDSIPIETVLMAEGYVIMGRILFIDIISASN
jgi:hypothetical protein